MSEKDNLSGLRGWLILLGIGVVIGPIRSFSSGFVWFSQASIMLNDGTLEVMTTPGSEYYHGLWLPLFVFELIYAVALCFAALYLVYLFFTKHAWFPKVYIIISLIGIGVTALDAWLVTLILPNASMFDVESGRLFIQQIIGAIIWIPYLLSSERVKATFVEKLPDNVPGQSSYLPRSAEASDGTPGLTAGLELAYSFQGYENTEEVLAIKGRKYGNLLTQWCKDDAYEFLRLARKEGVYNTQGTQNSESDIRDLSAIIAARYTIHSLVLVQSVYPDSRVKAWSEELVSVMVNMVTINHVDGTELKPVQQLLGRLFVSDYCETNVQEQQLKDAGVGMCRVLDVKHPLLRLHLPLLQANRFGDDHIRFLLASSKDWLELIKRFKSV
jgi:hypothetical protein